MYCKMRLLSPIAIILSVNLLKANQLPNDIQVCNVEDIQCISKASSDFIRKTIPGRVDMGIPKLDPFTITSLLINSASDGPLTLDLSLLNVQIEGLSAITFDKAVGFSKDPITSKFELYGNMPKVNIKGQYKVDGRIFVLPIQGDGNITIQISGMKISLKFKPSLAMEKNGKQYLKMDKVKVKLEPSTVHMELTNLFNGNKALGDNMNLYLNQNWNDVWQEVSPSVNLAIGEVVRNLLDGMFSRYAYDELFLQ